MLEELNVWPKITIRESLRLKALPYLRQWISESRSADATAGDIPVELVPALGEMSRKVWIDWDGKLWKTTRRGFRVEILTAAERWGEVLLMCHEGMGHRQLGSVYEYFCRRY